MKQAIWKSLFLWVEYHVVWSKNNPLFMGNMGLKTPIFNKNAIKYTKWPLLTAYNSWILPDFLIKQNGILLREKGSFRWPASNSMKKIIEKVQNWQIHHAHFISCKPPHKNHPREYFETTLEIIQIATSVVEKSQILSVAFHLSFTVWWILVKLMWLWQKLLHHSLRYQPSYNPPHNSLAVNLHSSGFDRLSLKNISCTLFSFNTLTYSYY